MPPDVGTWISFGNFAVLIGSILYGIGRFHQSIRSIRKEMEDGISGLQKEVDQLGDQHYSMKTHVDYIRGKMNGTNPPKGL